MVSNNSTTLSIEKLISPIGLSSFVIIKVAKVPIPTPIIPTPNTIHKGLRDKRITYFR